MLPTCFPHSPHRSPTHIYQYYILANSKYSICTIRSFFMCCVSVHERSDAWPWSVDRVRRRSCADAFYRSLNTVKLCYCYSESGWPRHIFSLLPSSRYSQMTNLPRETKGNNLGAVDLRGLQCDGGCVTLGLRAGRERQRHRAHSSQTKMRGGGRGDYTPHKDAPFLVFLCYRPPRDVPYRDWTWRRGGGGASGENFCDQEG